MWQYLNCSECGVNRADKPLIALPMTYICDDCYKKQKSLEEQIKQLKKQLNCLSDLVVIHHPETWEYYLEDIKQVLRGGDG